MTGALAPSQVTTTVTTFVAPGAIVVVPATTPLIVYVMNVGVAPLMSVGVVVILESFAGTLPLFLIVASYVAVAAGYARFVLNVALVPVKLGAVTSVAPVAAVRVIPVIAISHVPVVVPVSLIVSTWANAA